MDALITLLSSIPRSLWDLLSNQTIFDFVGGYPGLFFLIFVILVLVLIFLNLRAKRKLEAKVKLTFRKRLEGWISGLSAFFAKLKKGIIYLFSDREWMYRSPWQVMIGPRHANRCGITAHLDKIQREREKVHYMEKNLHSLGSRWFFLKQGIIIDPGEGEMDAEDSNDLFSHEWDAAIQSLKQVRSERPIDGVLLTIPVDMLINNESFSTQNLIDELQAKLLHLQSTMEFILPVYVVLSDCHHLKGFQEFWQIQKQASSQQIFGWSSPYRIEEAFSPEWVDEAMAYLSSVLRNIQVQSVSLDDDNLGEDGYYLFPLQVQSLQKNLKHVLAELFIPSKYLANCIFRGVYLCGELQEGKTFDLSINPREGSNPAIEPTSLAFIDDVIDRKIFSESRLAKPTVKGFFSRNNYIRRFQISVAVFFLAIFSALLAKKIYLDNQVSTIVEVVRYSEELRDPRLSSCDVKIPQKQIYKYLTDIAEIDDDLSSVLIPQSWNLFNDMPNDLAKSLSDRAFEEIIFHNIQCHLKDEAEKIAILELPPERAIQMRTLTDYLDKVSVFEKNRARFEAISPQNRHSTAAGETMEEWRECRSGQIPIVSWQDQTVCEDPMDAFIAINEFIFDDSAPPILSRPNGQHQKALREVDFSFDWGQAVDDSLSSIPLPQACMAIAAKQPNTASNGPVSQSLIARNICVLADAHRRQLERNSLLEHYELPGYGSIDDGIDNLIDNEPAMALTAINEWIDYVNTEWIVHGNGNGPCVRTLNAMDPYLDELIQRYKFPEELFTQVKAMFNDDNCENVMWNKMASQNIPPAGQLLYALNQQEGQSANASQTAQRAEYVINPAYDTVIPALKSLQSVSFMSMQELPMFTCEVGTEAWDTSYLSQIVSLYQEFENFAKNNNLPINAWQNHISSRIAHRKLNLVINHLLAQAQQLGVSRFYPAPDHVFRPMSDQESKVADKSKRFDLAKSDLLQVLGILRQMNMTKTFTGLTQCGRRYAVDALNELDALVATSQLYRKIPKSFSDASAFTNYMFQIDGKGDLKEYLQDQHKRAALVAKYADPFVTFMLNSDNVNGEGWAGNVLKFNYWNNTLREFSKFNQAVDENNQVQKLDDYLTYMLGEINIDNCNDQDFSFPTDIGNDLFSMRRLDIQTRVVRSCNQFLSSGIAVQYRQLAQAFKSDLAAKYPFQDPKGTPRTALQPKVVRDFLLNYGTGLDMLSERAYMLARHDSLWRELSEFLLEMKAVRDFFASNLGAPKAAQPLLLDLDFLSYRRVQGGTNASSDIAALRLDNGNTQVSLFNAAPSLAWNYASPLIVNIEWAKNSDYVPILTGTSVFTQDSGNPNLLSIRMEGQWALLKFLQTYRSTDAELLKSRVPATVPVEIPLTLRHVDDKAMAPTVVVRNVVFAVTVKGLNADTQQYETLELPAVFPDRAPAMASPSSSGQSDLTQR